MTPGPRHRLVSCASTPTRTLAALYQRGEELAYERGQEFDPSLWLSAALCDQVAAARVPGWFSPEDLAEPAGSDGRLIHGELV